VDTFADCEVLKEYAGSCEDDSEYISFSATSCMLTCDICGGEVPATTLATLPALSTKANEPAPTRTPEEEADIVRVLIFSTIYENRLFYHYSTDPYPPQGSMIYMPASENNEDDIDEFYLSSKKSKIYSRIVRFCKGRYGEVQKYLIRPNECGKTGWTEAMKLYAPAEQTSFSVTMFSQTLGSTPWMSRVHTGKPCCGYKSKQWRFYTSKKPETFDESAAMTTAAPLVTRAGTLKPLTEIEKGCLAQHNYLRALHNTPPLVWDADLAVTANMWGQYLIEAAAITPLNLAPGYKKTRAWPHSDKGTIYRDSSIGENIAWEMKRVVTPVEDLVNRWYAESFDFNYSRPLEVIKSRPTGHYTQLMWGNSKRMGCALKTKKAFVYGGNYEASYLVTQYYPGGNVQSYNLERSLMFYDTNVKALKNGTCTSDPFCRFNGNSGCKGFGESFKCTCSKQNGVDVPRCFGKLSGGCVVSCPKAKFGASALWETQCQGETLCTCDVVKGATCR